MTSPSFKMRRPLVPSPRKVSSNARGWGRSLFHNVVRSRYFLLTLLLATYIIMINIQSQTLRKESSAFSAAFVPDKADLPPIWRSVGNNHEIEAKDLQGFGADFPFHDELSKMRNWNFPRWEEDGIKFSALKSFIQAMPSNATTLPWARTYQQFPELLYIVDGRGLFVSNTRRMIITMPNQRYRVFPTEDAMRLAFQALRDDKAQKWPRLRRALSEGGFPFVVWNGDFLACNKNNFRGLSIPVFTVCASVSCNYSFPLPTYKTVHDSKFSAREWDDTFREYDKNFSLSEKLPQVVWRGSLTGALKNYTSDRARIARFPVDHPSPLLNIGLSSIPERHVRANQSVNVAYFGGLAKSIKPQERFMSYMGIIDIDGNSWSSRFGKLLCYNSVILKVEPQYIDYFYKSLVPWTHFIPVKHDLSDLISKARFVTDRKNQDIIQRIVYNANSWCRRHMIFRVISHDILDIWEEYVHLLDRGNPEWQVDWNRLKKDITQSQDFGMQRLNGRYKVIRRVKN